VTSTSDHAAMFSPPIWVSFPTPSCCRSWKARLLEPKLFVSRFTRRPSAWRIP